MKLSHFHSQSVVKLVSQSEQTVPAHCLLPLNSPFHGCRGRGSTHFAKNMKEHFTWQSPFGFPPFFELTVKILTQEGESKLHFALMHQTLCPFELLMLLEGGACAGHRDILGSFLHSFSSSTCRTNLRLLTDSLLKALPC